MWKKASIALFTTATITALVVVTVGTLPFLGLVIPNTPIVKPIFISYG
ncbi:hypothetical protein G6Y30_08150 [Staphylococcus aureus]|nr:hypothetical protein [Staphylococcus aureus]